MQKEVFRFERGSYFSGSLEYVIYECDSDMLFEEDSGNDFLWMKQYSFLFPKSEMSIVLDALAIVRRWETYYEGEEDIDDGETWDIMYDYNGISIHSGGYEAYPDDYREGITALQNAMEELCAKYSAFYSKMGLKKRLEL